MSCPKQSLIVNRTFFKKREASFIGRLFCASRLTINDKRLTAKGIIEIPVLLAIVAMIVASAALFATPGTPPNLPPPSGEAICEPGGTFKIRIFWSNQGSNWFYRVNWEGHTGSPDLVYDYTRNSSDYISGIPSGPRNLTVYVRTADGDEPYNPDYFGPTATGIITIPNWSTSSCVAPPAANLSVNLSASQTYLTSPGNVSLTWTTGGNPTSCTGSSLPTNPNWVGSKPTSGGSQTIYVTQSTEFAIVCSNATTSSTPSNVTVTVASAPSSPPPASAPTAPTNPRIGSNNCSSGATTVQFLWDASSSGADYYEINWDLSGTSRGQAAVRTPDTGAHFEQPNFQPGLAIGWWDVRAVKNGLRSGWTNAAGFSAAPCAQPTPSSFSLISPSSGASTTSNPTFTWTNSQNANRFYVYIGDGSWKWFRQLDGTGITSVAWNNGSLWQDAKTNQLLSNIQIPPGTYGWSVGAHNVTGGIEGPTVWSTPVTQSFVVPAPVSAPSAPTNPRITTNTCLTTTTRIQFIWDASSTGADYYELNWEFSGTPRGQAGARTASSGANLTVDNFQPGLPIGWWDVRAVKNNLQSSWTNVAGFTAAPCVQPQPVPSSFNLSSPAGGQTVTNNPTFNWTNSQNANRFYVYIGQGSWKWFRQLDSAGATSVGWNNGSLWQDATTNQLLSTLQIPPGNYSWSVGAHNVTNGVEGPTVWSTPVTQNFTVPEPPASRPSPPTNLRITENQCAPDGVHARVDFSWDAAAGATGYEWNIDKSGIAQGTTAANTITPAFFSSSEFNAATTFNWWQVRSIKTGAQPSDWVNAPPGQAPFNSAACAEQKPGTFTLSSPTSGQTVENKPSFNWSPSERVHHYYIQIGQNGTGLWYRRVDGTGTTWTGSNDWGKLTPSAPDAPNELPTGTYVWNVHAYNAGDTLETTAENGPFSFTVPQAPPTRPDPPPHLNPPASTCNFQNNIKARVNFSWGPTSGVSYSELNWEGSGVGKNTDAAATSHEVSYTSTDFSSGSHIGWWQVRNVSAAGAKSDWKDGPAFDTASCPAPEAVRLVSTSCAAVTLTWLGTGGSTNNARPDEIGFWLDVATEPSFTTYSNKWTTANTTTTDNWTTTGPITALISGQTYFARVFNGNHSAVLQFSYNPPNDCLPQIQIQNIQAVNNYSGPDGFGHTVTNGCVIAPADAPTLGKPAIKITWSTNPAVAQSKLTWDFGGPQNYPESGTTPNHEAVISGWDHNKPYTVNINSIAPGTKENTVPVNFTTVDCRQVNPILEPPTNVKLTGTQTCSADRNNVTVSFQWDASSSSPDRYELNWANSGIPRGSARTQTTGSLSFFQFAEFEPDSEIAWWEVRAIKGTQTSTWTVADPPNISTISCALPAPSNLRVTNTTCTNATLNWDGTGTTTNNLRPSEVGFWLDVATDSLFPQGNFSNKWVTANSTTTDNWTYTGVVTLLVSGQTYYARVFNGSHSNVINFTYSPPSSCTTIVNSATCNYTGSATTSIDVLKGESNGISFTATGNAQGPSGPWVPGVKLQSDARDAVTNYDNYRIPIGPGLTMAVGATSQRSFSLNAGASKQVDFVFYAASDAATSDYKLKDLILVNAPTSTSDTDVSCTGSQGLTINVKTIDGPPNEAPIDGAYISGYRFLEKTSGGILHPGLDLSTRNSPPNIKNPFPGEAIVTSAGYYNNEGGYGNRVVLKSPSGKWTTKFAHLKSINVTPGQTVGPDAILGVEGNTGFVESDGGGIHLHYEIAEDGKLVNPEQYGAAVTTPPPPAPVAPTVTLTSDKPAATPGSTITLTWTLGNNPEGCTAVSSPTNNQWAGNIEPASDSKPITINTTTTFTLGCSNRADSTTDTTTVVVNETGTLTHNITSLSASCNDLNLNNINVTWDTDLNASNYQLQRSQNSFETLIDETFESYDTTQPGYTLSNQPSNTAYYVRVLYKLKDNTINLSTAHQIYTKDCATIAVVIGGLNGNANNLVTPIVIGNDVEDAFATVVKYNPGWDKRVTVQIKDYKGDWQEITSEFSTAQIGPAVWVDANSAGVFTTFPYDKPFTNTPSLVTMYNLIAFDNAQEGNYNFEARIVNSSGTVLDQTALVGIANVRKKPTNITEKDEVVYYLRQRFANAGSYTHRNGGTYPIADVVVGVSGGETGGTWNPKSDGRFSSQGMFKGMWQFGPKSIASAWCCGTIPGALATDDAGNRILNLFNTPRSTVKISPSEWDGGIRYKSPDGRTYTDAQVNPWKNSTDSGPGQNGGCIDADARCDLELSTNRFEVQMLVNNLLNTQGQWQPWDEGTWLQFKNYGKIASQSTMFAPYPSGPRTGNVGDTMTYRFLPQDIFPGAKFVTIDFGNNIRLTVEASRASSYPFTIQYTEAGVYYLKAMVSNDTQQSAWSDPISIQIVPPGALPTGTASPSGYSTPSFTVPSPTSAATSTPKNLTPYVPDKPQGPTSATTGETLTFSVSGSDPEKDKLQYIIDWGNGDISTVYNQESGSTYEFEHAWFSPGVYYVKVTAFDGKTGAQSEPLIVVISQPSDASACKKLFENGPPSDTIDVTFIPAYYQQGNFFEFEKAARKMMGGFYHYSPYAENISKFNFRLVFEQSNAVDLGIDFGPNGSVDINAIKKVAGKCPTDQTMVIAYKSFRSFATGADLSVVAAAEPAPVAIHEFSHTFANLWDEYVEKGRKEPSNKNHNCYDSKIDTPWKGITGTSTFKGCTVDSWYRPTDNSLMNDGRQTRKDALDPWNSYLIKFRIDQY